MVSRITFPRLLPCALLVFGVACGGDADPRTVEGAVSFAAAAVERSDATSLFRVIDQRARHAMASIVADRNRAAAIVARDYPAEARPEALASLGDAVGAADAPALFARRCGEPCFAELRGVLGAPRELARTGDEVVATTARGTEIRLHLGSDGWYGLVWRTPELDRERTQASRDVEVVERNAEVYRRRRELE